MNRNPNELPEKSKMTDAGPPTDQPAVSSGKRADFFPPLDMLIDRIDSEILGMLAKRNGPENVSGETGKPKVEAKFETIGQYICFSLGQARLAVEITFSPEVGYVPPVTPLPNLPDWLKGVSNIRGEIVSMIDLKGFLKFPGKVEPNEKRRLIVVQSGETKTGLIVDYILGILSSDRHRVDFRNYSREPGDITGLLDNYVSRTAIFKRRDFHVLDTEKLFACPRMNRFSR